MVGAMIVGGGTAWFWMVPLLGAIGVWSIYRFGCQVMDPPAGVAAAVLLSLSPVYLYQLFQPMSDVPAAALWAAALALASGGIRGATPTAVRAAGAGLVTGIAILIRPNLAPLAIVPVLLMAWRGSRPDWRTGLAFATGTLPGVAAVAAVQAAIYGSPLRSGYGSLEHLFSLSHIALNMRRYPVWLADTHTPLLLLAVAAPFVMRPRRVGWLLLGFAAATLAAYLPYVPFEDWSFARFLLPAVPPLIVLTLAVVRAGAMRVAGRWSVLVFAAAVIGLGGWWMHIGADLGVTRVKSIERKYPELGHYAAARLPRNAIVLGAQSTGAIRYYSSLPTLSWDQIDPAWLERVVAELTGRGLTPYLAVESFETDMFRRRFRDHSVIGQLDWPARATFGRAISLYRLDDRPRYLRGERIPTDRFVWPLK
jgi:hypothetical protein